MSYVVVYGDRFDILIKRMRDNYSHFNLPDNDADLIAMMTLRGFEIFLNEGWVKRTIAGISNCNDCKHCERFDDNGFIETIVCDQPLSDEDSEKAYEEHCPHFEEVV